MAGPPAFPFSAGADAADTADHVHRPCPTLNERSPTYTLAAAWPKTLQLALATAVVLSSGCSTTKRPPLRVVTPDCPSIAPAHRKRLHEVVDELNLARTRPQHYAALLAREYAQMTPDGYIISGTRRIRTVEGRKAVDEATAYLRGIAPRKAVALDTCLSWAAHDHAAELGRVGGMSHMGRNGSQPSDRAARRLGTPAYCGENLDFGTESPREHITSLIVDDGVASRGHRENLFQREYASVGIGIGTHPDYGSVTVQLLCNDLRHASAGP